MSYRGYLICAVTEDLYTEKLIFHCESSGDALKKVC